MFTLQDLHQVAFHIDVDIAVTVEGSAAFSMTGEGGDEVRILDQLVDVADEGTAGHVAACHFVYRYFGFRSGNRVELGHKISYTCLFQYGLDVFIK